MATMTSDDVGDPNDVSRRIPSATTGALPGYVIGVDFGTLSARAVVVRVDDGTEIGESECHYRHGVMDQELASTGKPLPPDWALQDALDYVEALQTAVPQALASSGVDPSKIVGIATDFTACTVLPALSDGTPLSALPELRHRPHAYAKLWRHHAAQEQADRINALAEQESEPWLSRYGGRISSEWEFAKGLQLLEEDPALYHRAERWVEAADWIVWQLCGLETRNTCTAGYKGIFQDGSYPSPRFLGLLHPEFDKFPAQKLGQHMSILGSRVGGLTEHAASLTGLPAGIAVATGNVDAHVTAAAAQTISPGHLLAVMGTSNCHVMNGDHLAAVPGMCGVVDGGIADGYWGYELGQSGVGDIFAWFLRSSLPARYEEMARERGVDGHTLLSELAAAQHVGEHGLVALDWHSGNRSILVDHQLSGLLVGATLATKPEDEYRALVEATAFGTRRIIEALDSAGVAVEEFVAGGGLIRNAFVMQVYADVMHRPIGIIASDQGPALGSAIHAAVAAGCYASVAEASRAMGRVHRNAFIPDEQRARVYDLLYAEYLTLHDYFGRGHNDVMHRLRHIRNEAAGS
jgi:L-ribulokinase